MVGWFLRPQLDSSKVSCCCRDFSVAVYKSLGDITESGSISIAHSSIFVRLDGIHCGEWVFDLNRQLPTGLRSLRAEGHTVSDSLRPWAPSHAHTPHTHTFPNWQWKGFQGKHLIALLFSVFKLSPLTLMLTDIELCKGGGGWHVIFKSRDLLFVFF